MTGPIFIVGPPRSGTELARSILNRHHRIHIALETHWFDDLRPRMASSLASPTAKERERILAYFLSLDRHGYGLRSSDFSNDRRAELIASWATIGPGADDAFEAFCKLKADAAKKDIWGEKTPRHLFRAADILATFPTAKILVCIRDPRGVVASYRDWRNNWFDRETLTAAEYSAVLTEEARASQSYGLTLTTLLWRSCATAALRLHATENEDYVHILQFEQLLADPEAVCRRMARWLGVEFDPAMLNINVSNSSYTLANQVERFDQRASIRWRERLSENEARYVSWLARERMIHLGYDPGSGLVAPSFLLQKMAAFPQELVRAVRANRSRIGDLPAYLKARLSGLV